MKIVGMVFFYYHHKRMKKKKENLSVDKQRKGIKECVCCFFFNALKFLINVNIIFFSQNHTFMNMWHDKFNLFGDCLLLSVQRNGLQLRLCEIKLNYKRFNKKVKKNHKTV
jgi:hypothetical protein